jgi:hypothetical protein
VSGLALPSAQVYDVGCADRLALTASIFYNPSDYDFERLLQGMINGHFKCYKQINADPQFAKTFLDRLFERYYQHAWTRAAQ